MTIFGTCLGDVEGMNREAVCEVGEEDGDVVPGHSVKQEQHHTQEQQHLPDG